MPPLACSRSCRNPDQSLWLRTDSHDQLSLAWSERLLCWHEGMGRVLNSRRQTRLGSKSRNAFLCLAKMIEALNFSNLNHFEIIKKFRIKAIIWDESHTPMQAMQTAAWLLPLRRAFCLRHLNYHRSRRAQSSGWRKLRWSLPWPTNPCMLYHWPGKHL